MRVLLHLGVLAAILVLICVGIYCFDSKVSSTLGGWAIAAAVATLFLYYYLTKWRPLRRGRKFYEQALIRHNFDRVNDYLFDKNLIVGYLRGCSGFGDFHIEVNSLYSLVSPHVCFFAGQYTATGEGWEYGFFLLIIYDDEKALVGREFDRWFSKTGRMRQLLKGMLLPVHQGENLRLIDIPSTEIASSKFAALADLLVGNVVSLVAL
jgi:hypothetical protein